MRRLTKVLCTTGTTLALLSPAIATSASASAPTADPTPSASTLADLSTAMHGEAYAWAKYTLFGEQATREGRTSAATLFASTAKVERTEHFVEEGELAGVPADNVANLKDAIAGENYETTTMYPTFARQAARQGDTGAAEMFTEIGADEARHRDAYAQALTYLTTGTGSIPQPWSLDYFAVTPSRSSSHGTTFTNLRTAMHGEATASTKYDMYAQVARKSGNPALAALFASTAQIEFREHFSEEAQRSGLVRLTNHNLNTSAQGENTEATHMYPNMARRALRHGDTAAATLFWEISRDEAKHRDAFLAELCR